MNSDGCGSNIDCGDSSELYEVSSWEVRSALDQIAVGIYWIVVRAGQILVVLVAAFVLAAIGGMSILLDPAIGLLTILSALPALALAVFVWWSDVTPNEPPILLASTFLLGVLTAGFAALLNSLIQTPFAAYGVVGLIGFFYLVVGPVEETVKLLAVRLYAYNDERFRAVIDGAVYGAVAGLGFAFIENAVYINRVTDGVGTIALSVGVSGAGGGIMVTRALAGPGHVVYSAIAGYYLGLAKFNPGDRGPIVVKGLIIAAVLHATYNASVGFGIEIIRSSIGVSTLVAFFLFVLGYVGGAGYVLYRKINRYRSAYSQGAIGRSDIERDGD